MKMNEKLKVLKMLEEGKITAEEAEKLLNAINMEKHFRVGSGRLWNLPQEISRLKVNLKAGNLIISEDDLTEVKYNGFIDWEKEEDDLIFHISYADVKIKKKKGVKLILNNHFGNSEVTTSSDIEGLIRLGNLVLNILNPVNLTIENSFGNVDINYFTIPDAEFFIDNHFGSFKNDFKDAKGSKVVRIKNRFGSVSINKKTGG
jgi:hypothetical protein